MAAMKELLQDDSSAFRLYLDSAEQKVITIDTIFSKFYIDNKY